MDDVASRIVAHYERHATSWDGDRRAAAWISPASSASLVSLPRARSREPFNPTRDFS